MTPLQRQTEGDLKLALEWERDRLRASLVRREQAEQELAQSEHDESSPGGSQADVASDVTEQTLEVSLERTERAQLAEVEAGLRRLASGRYGVCEKCGQQIALARLAALPWTPFCVNCARS